MNPPNNNTEIGWTAAKALAALNIIAAGWLFSLVVSGSQEASDERAEIIREQHTETSDIRERVAKLEQFKEDMIRDQQEANHD